MSVGPLRAIDELKLLRSGKISSLKLAKEHIRRIEQLNPVLDAIVDKGAAISLWLS